MTNLKANHTKGKALTLAKLAEVTAFKLAKLAETATSATELAAKAATLQKWFEFQSQFATA